MSDSAELAMWLAVAIATIALAASIWNDINQMHYQKEMARWCASVVKSNNTHHEVISELIDRCEKMDKQVIYLYNDTGDLAIRVKCLEARTMETRFSKQSNLKGRNTK